MIEREPRSGVRSAPAGVHLARVVAAVENGDAPAMAALTDRMATLEAAFKENVTMGATTDRHVVALREDLARLTADPYSFKRDLLERLTSRVFLLCVAAIIVISAAALQGAVAWDDAVNALVMLAGIFGGAEAIRDAASSFARRPAQPPTQVVSVKQEGS